jgi:hypothetical protein
MSVFLSAFLLIVLLALLGHRLGAIRGAIGVLGIIVGGALAVPLAPLVTPLMIKAGSTNPLWNWVLPPVLVFVGVQVLFGALALLVHHKVMMFYKYKATDEARHRWERMNARVGVSLGVVSGIGYTVILGTLVYALGYLTHQLQPAAGQPEPRAWRLLNRLREDQSATGFDRLIAALDPTPKGFYEAADLLGLLYHNPPLQGRLGNYPALLELGERPEIKDLANDVKFTEFLLSKPGFFAVLEHPKVRQVIAEAEVIQAIQSLSPADLLQFVRTGTSALYDSEPILGRWLVAPQASLAAAYRETPSMTGADVAKLRQRLDSFAGLNFIATPDHKAIARGAGANDTGTWQKSGSGYTLNVRGPQGVTFTEASHLDGRLLLRAPREGLLVVFDKSL